MTQTKALFPLDGYRPASGQLAGHPDHCMDSHSYMAPRLGTTHPALQDRSVCPIVLTSALGNVGRRWTQARDAAKEIIEDSFSHIPLQGSICNLPAPAPTRTHFALQRMDIGKARGGRIQCGWNAGVREAALTAPFPHPLLSTGQGIPISWLVLFSSLRLCICP